MQAQAQVEQLAAAVAGLEQRVAQLQKASAADGAASKAKQEAMLRCVLCVL